MELRNKLDWTRQKADKGVRRARAQASALRTKWALLCGDGKSGKDSLLDSMPVNTSHLGHSASTPALPPGRGGVEGGAGGTETNRNSQQEQDRHELSRGGARGRGSQPSPGGKGGIEAWAADGRVGSRGGTGGGVSPSLSEPALTMKQGQRRVTTSGGSAGIGSKANVGVRRGSPSVGAVSSAAGLSAGRDRGQWVTGGLTRGRGGVTGSQRPPWTEQGTGGGAGGHSQLLYA